MNINIYIYIVYVYIYIMYMYEYIYYVYVYYVYVCVYLYIYIYEPPSKSIVYAWYKNISYRFFGVACRFTVICSNQKWNFDLGS